MKNIMIIAGEPSGDMHGAALVKAANRLDDSLNWVGIGGPLMREAGVKTLHDIREMAVVGIVEVLKRYSFFRRVFFEILEEADRLRPDAVVLIDYPGFNLRLAERLHKLGIKVVYYICPQVWAWHRERIPKMAKIIDHLVTIYPFEAQHFDGTGLKVTYAGNPLVDEIRESCQHPPSPLPWKRGRRVAILPGSRAQEIKRILGDMWKAAAILEQMDHSVSFIIAASDNNRLKLIREITEGTPGPANVEIVAGKTRDILREADAAMVTSGTATVETALLRCPMVVVYRLNPLSYSILKRLVKVDYAGMVNIMAEREICPELIQSNLTPQKLAELIYPLTHDTEERATMLAGIDEVIRRLGDGGTAEHTAQILLDEIQNG